jgi:hypothetical protein
MEDGISFVTPVEANEEERKHHVHLEFELEKSNSDMGEDRRCHVTLRPGRRRMFRALAPRSAKLSRLVGDSRRAHPTHGRTGTGVQCR